MTPGGRWQGRSQGRSQGGSGDQSSKQVASPVADKNVKNQRKIAFFLFHVHFFSRRFAGQLLIPADSPEEEKAWPS
jgi:hypothetical protein